ncbi:MAG: hypothetical protein L6R42_002608, partial [Xanthoria sp. 1 TBL-2021]
GGLGEGGWDGMKNEKEIGIGKEGGEGKWMLCKEDESVQRARKRERIDIKANAMNPSSRSLLYVEGNCTMNKFQDKEGNQQSAMSIIQRHVEVLDRRNSDGGSGGESES